MKVIRARKNPAWPGARERGRKSLYFAAMESAESNPLEQLAGRRFAFYPAIRNVEHNEWTLEEESWSEIRAKNAETGQALWIPRGHLGEISSTDAPVLIVGLKRELELKAGEAVPHRKSDVSIPGPRATKPPEEVAESEPPEPARTDSTTDTKTLRLIGRALAIGAAAVLAVALLVSGTFPTPLAALFRTDSTTADQRYLGLSAQDGYYDVAQTMGEPEQADWLTKDEADLHFQVLRYPSRRYVVVMMGGSRADMRYIGALHAESRKILDSARMGGGDTTALLRNLPEF